MASSEEPAAEARVVCHLGEILARRGMTLTDLSTQTGITMANLSILKTNKARAVRFSTLVAVCAATKSSPGEMFSIDFP